MKTLKKNEEIKGKIVTFKTFRDLLLEEMKKNFPEQFESYEKYHEVEQKQIKSEVKDD